MHSASYYLNGWTKILGEEEIRWFKKCARELREEGIKVDTRFLNKNYLVHKITTKDDILGEVNCYVYTWSDQAVRNLIEAYTNFCNEIWGVGYTNCYHQYKFSDDKYILTMKSTATEIGCFNNFYIEYLDNFIKDYFNVVEKAYYQRVR